MATYHIKIDEQFIVERSERIRAQQPRIGGLSLTMIFGVGLFVVGVIGWITNSDVLLGVAIGMLLLVLIRHFTDDALARRAINSDPTFGQIMRVAPTEDGISIASDLGSSNLKWRAITGSTRVPDGFLVFSGVQTYWWPDSALVEGSADDVERLLKRVAAAEMEK